MKKLLTTLGIDPARLEMFNLSAAMGPRWAQMQDLNMLTCTEGKERTLSEYADLLRRVGFRDVEGRALESPLDALCAWK